MAQSKAYTFPGGMWKITPGGSFVDNTGKVIEYDSSVKLVGAGKFPVKVSPEAIEALIYFYEHDEDFAAFIASLPRGRAYEG
jgi:hypothetical protein